MQNLRLANVLYLVRTDKNDDLEGGSAKAKPAKKVQNSESAVFKTADPDKKMADPENDLTDSENDDLDSSGG